MTSPFARDGHLLDLALDRLLARDLDAADALETQAHLDVCDACRARLDAAGALVRAPLPPLALPPRGDVVRIPFRRWGAADGVLALAAASLLFLRQPPESFTARGDGLTLEVYRHDGETVRQVSTGDVVAPGDRLGFRVTAGEAGHLLVLGVDSLRTTYRCFPQDGDAAPFGPGSETLDTAVELDGTPGSERLVALWCPEPFTWARAAREAAAGTTPAGCVSDTVVLDKAGP